MRVQKMHILLCVLLLLCACTAPAEEVSDTTAEPAATAEPSAAPTVIPFINDVDEPEWISGEIRDYFAGLCNDTESTDLPLSPQDDRGLPYARLFRYEDVSDIDLRQYLEETLVAHFEHKFGDVVMERLPYKELNTDPANPGMLAEYRLCYAGEEVSAALAAVKDGSDMICFAVVYDTKEGFDTEALILETLPGHLRIYGG